MDPNFGKSAWNSSFLGGLSGGIGAELSGGDFWRGAGQGATVALLNHYAHQEDKNKDNQTVPQTGDKFYDENGNLVWDTKMEGKPNIVRVIKNEDMKLYKYKLAYARDVNSPGILLSWARKNSIEYTLGKINSNSKSFYTYAKRGTYRDAIAAIHFMGEGMASGYMKGITYKPQPGLSNHYSQQFGARNYWLDYYSMKKFNSWW